MIIALFNYYYALIVSVVGTTIIGITAGILGSFALVRRQSLLGDAISHAALPGIALIFLVTHNPDPFVLLIGGGIAGLLGATGVIVISSATTVRTDALLGIVLSVFFGIGLILLTVIQKQLIAHQAILGKFLFGNAATLLWHDVVMLIIVSAILLMVLLALWNPFCLISFDPAFATLMGYPVGFLSWLLTGLLIGIIVIGLHAVGVLLMSSLLIAPAAAARQWTDRMHKVSCIAGLFGGLSGFFGSYLSSLIPHVPTGPVVVIISSLFVIASLLFAPLHGILWQYRRKRRV